MEHNARVRMASAASEGRRARFLLNHIEVLLPFITPQAAAQIRCAAAGGRAPVLLAVASARVCGVRGGWVAHKIGPRCAPRLPSGMSGDLPPRRQRRDRGGRYRAATYNAAADPIHAPVEAQPACLQGEMREYQVEGLRWMVSRLGDSGVNAILADEMARPCAGRAALHGRPCVPHHASPSMLDTCTSGQAPDLELRSALAHAVRHVAKRMRCGGPCTHYRAPPQSRCEARPAVSARRVLDPRRPGARRAWARRCRRSRS
jgi:hypothetical protein